MPVAKACGDAIRGIRTRAPGAVGVAVPGRVAVAVGMVATTPIAYKAVVVHNAEAKCPVTGELSRQDRVPLRGHAPTA